VFSVKAFSQRRNDDAANLTGIITAVLSAVTWIVYTAFWIYQFPTLPYLYVAYLWLAFGIIFVLVAIVYIAQYAVAAYRRQQEGTLTFCEHEEGY
jgi:fatty acid desaturase